jgi:putative transposase
VFQADHSNASSTMKQNSFHPQERFIGLRHDLRRMSVCCVMPPPAVRRGCFLGGCQSCNRGEIGSSSGSRNRSGSSSPRDAARQWAPVYSRQRYPAQHLFGFAGSEPGTARVLLIGYCLMSNHVHLVLIPRKPESMGLALKHAHGRFASYWNAAHRTSGHVWQGRYYSCPLDETHLWTALRYTELNPVRAGLVEEAQRWEWSSAAAHCASAPAEALAMELWLTRWCAESWRAFLGQQESDMELDEIRRSTHTGRPLGVREFVRTLERSTQRRLAPEKRGRPRKTVANPQQSVLPLSFSP